MRALPTALVPLLLALAACAGTAPPAAAPTSSADSAALVREAEAFMEGYARDLLAGDRQAIVDRYDQRGGWRMGNGHKQFMPLDSIRGVYFGRWRPPARFAWQDLSYEVAGPDAIVVVGKFVWGLANGQDVTLSYTGLLLRRDGRLRIRVEDESSAPPPRPSPPPPADTTAA